MSEIKIGDSVICVDDRTWDNQRGTWLVYRNVYTVLDILKCDNCGGVCYDIGAKWSDSTQHNSCCKIEMPGAGIHWSKASRFKPYIKNFKNFCRKEIMEKMQKEVHTLIEKKEYEKAIDLVKRMEKIDSEL